MPKQSKRKKKKPAARVAGPRVQKWVRALLVLLVLTALLAAFVVVIPVTRCETRGNTRYSVVEFAAAMELDNHELRLYNLDKPALARKIHAALPYAHVVSIKRVYPNALRVTAEELVPIFAQEQDGGWWLLSEGGKLLEFTAQPPGGLLLLTGARLESPKAGRNARWVDAFTGPGDLAQLRNALRESPLWSEITGMRISAAALPDVLYQGRIRLRFSMVFAQIGVGDGLQEKMRMAEQVLADLNAQNPDYYGLLDLSTPGKANFTPEWENQEEKEGPEAGEDGQDPANDTQNGETP